jgi:hypothetical protein
MTEEESAAVRQAIYKILAPWIGGGISVDEWCVEVDRWFPDLTSGSDEMTTSADHSSG